VGGAEEIWGGLLDSNGSAITGTRIRLDAGCELEASVVSSDELEIFFAKESGPTKYDVVHGTRAKKGDDFSGFVPLGTNTVEDDLPEFLSSDACDL